MADSRVVYKGVYVMKLIMAYVVVAIHTTDWSLMGLTETAVPYFFIASGFFLFRKLGGSREEDLTVIKQWILKILKLYLIWTAIYLPFTVVGFIRDGLSFQTATAVFLRNLIFVGENYLSWPLWYLLAMIWGGLLIYLMRRLRMPLWAMFLVGLTLYLVSRHAGLDNNPLFAKVFKGSDYAFFVSTLFLIIGGIVHRWESVHAEGNFALVIDSILLAITFAVFYFIPDYGVVLFTTALFLFSLHLDFHWLPKEYSQKAGAISKTVYLVHMVFAGLLILLTSIPEGWMLWLITAGCSSLLSWMLLQNRRGNYSWIV